MGYCEKTFFDKRFHFSCNFPQTFILKEHEKNTKYYEKLRKKGILFFYYCWKINVFFLQTILLEYNIFFEFF
jgi:hypothetical protein